MSSSSLVLGHPNADWDDQIEHVYNDNLSIVAAAMIVTDGTPGIARSMRFDEFNRFASDQEWRKAIDPVPRLFEGFNPNEKPILWIRLVALAHLCSNFVEREGPGVGIPPEPYDVAKMLGASADQHIAKEAASYREVITTAIVLPTQVVVLVAEPVSAASEISPH
jgi:hypothetical protein